MDILDKKYKYRIVRLHIILNIELFKFQRKFILILFPNVLNLR